MTEVTFVVYRPWTERYEDRLLNSPCIGSAPLFFTV